jgi:hypothetical protein
LGENRFRNSGKVARQNRPNSKYRKKRDFREKGSLKILLFLLYQFAIYSLATLPDTNISLYLKGESPGKTKSFVLPVSCHLAS